MSVENNRNHNRRERALEVREQAAKIAYNRQQQQHIANSDEQNFAEHNYVASFTKGLPHYYNTGLAKKEHFEAFVTAIEGPEVKLCPVKLST